MFILDLEIILLFSAAALILLITPGPAVLYIVTTSISRGQRAGIFSALGLGIGGMVHVIAAIAGVSTILAASATAFTVVKLLGAAYLIYLGIREIFFYKDKGSAGISAPQNDERKNLRAIFWQGMWVNILNPKAAIFFLAFLPQFINPAAGAVTTQLLALGMIFVILALVTDLGYALLAGKISQRISPATRNSRAGRFSIAAIYIGLGLATALGSKE